MQCPLSFGLAFLCSFAEAFKGSNSSSNSMSALSAKVSAMLHFGFSSGCPSKARLTSCRNIRVFMSLLNRKKQSSHQRSMYIGGTHGFLSFCPVFFFCLEVITFRSEEPVISYWISKILDWIFNDFLIVIFSIGKFYTKKNYLFDFWYYSWWEHNWHNKFLSLPWHLLVHILFMRLHLHDLDTAQLPMHLQKLRFPPIFRYISWACSAVNAVFPSCSCNLIPIKLEVSCGCGTNSSLPNVPFSSPTRLHKWYLTVPLFW